MDIQFTDHAGDMLHERNIPEGWVRRTIDSPDRTVLGADGNLHYIKAVPEHEGRFLRVIVNPHVTPNRVVTIFFDRRLRRSL
jgi:Domain of unknown function (DUF4258)